MRRVAQRRTAGAIIVFLAVLVVAACGKPPDYYSGKGPFTGTLTVWTDSTRQPGFAMYAKTHPNVKLSIQLASGSTQTAKIGLDNRIHKDWPDIVWDPAVANASWAKSRLSGGYAANLAPLVPASVRNNFNKGALDLCASGGKLYCLRNDLAQDVLWVNTKLMKKFGYQVPKTWQQYEALGLRVAKEHPGYIVGKDGDGGDSTTYLWGSQCSLQKLTGPNSVSINLKAPNCTRAFSMLDKLSAAGAMVPEQLTTPSFIKKYSRKILLMPGANWYGLLIFKGPLGIPAGTFAAAPPLTWAGNSGPSDGDDGGGLYFVSSHLKGAALKAAYNVVQWMATNQKWQDSGTTYPAYAPDDASWVKANAGNWFAQSAASLTKVMADSAKQVWPGWDYVPFNEYDPQFIVAAEEAHKPISSQLDQWQKALAGSARTFGYDVNARN